MSIVSSSPAVLRCGTRPLGGAHLRFDVKPFPFARRAFTYAFVDGNGPGSSPTPRPPAVNQNLSIAAAHAAVRRALDTWEAVEGVDPDTGETVNLGLRFTEINHIPEGTEDILFRWTPDPCEHKDEDDEWGAHADFPPGNAGGDNPWFYNGIPVDFNDDVQVWTSLAVEAFTLHEIGHALGLEHTDVAGAVMEQGGPLVTTLQDDDLAAVRALYPPQGPERYTAIWAKGTVDRRAVHGMAGDEVEDEVARQKEDGYRLFRINAFHKPGAGLRYNLVFEVHGADRIRVMNRTRASFDERANELKAEGWGPLSLSTVVLPDGESRWNAVYARDGAERDAVWGFERADVIDVIKTNRAKRLGLVELNAYLTPDGEERFNAVFWKRDRDTQFRLAYREEDLFDDDDHLADYSVIDYNAYVLPDGKGVRFNAVWERVEAEDAVWSGPKEDVRQRLRQEEAQWGYRAWVLHAHVPQTLATTPTGGTTTIPHEAPPAGQRVGTLGLALDGDRAYVTRYLEDAQPPHASALPGVVEAIDRATTQPVGAATVGFRPRAVAVNPVTRRLYVVNLDPRSYTVTVLDADSLVEVATIKVGQGPSAVAVNPVTNRIYVSNWFGRRVQVIDGATNTLLPDIATGPGPQGIAVDPTTNRLYVALSNRSFEPFVNAVAVYTDDGTTVTPGPRVDVGVLLTQSVDVAVDPTADRVYVANLGGGGVHPSVTALRKETLAHVATVNVPGPCRALAVNGAAGELYVAGDRGLQVLDTGSLRVRRTVDAGPRPFNVACDEGSGRQVWVGGVGREAVRLG